MLKDITLGQYFPINSVIHKIDPRVKIVSIIIIIVAIFFCKTPLSFILAVVFNIAIIIASKLSIRTVLSALKPVMFIIIFTALINLFLTKGEDYLLKWKFISITREGLESAITMAVRIILLVSFSSMLTFTTSPIMLTDGIESLLKPFSKLGMPAHELAMMKTIA